MLKKRKDFRFFQVIKWLDSFKDTNSQKKEEKE